MDTRDPSSFRNCLAYAAASDWASWLGRPSPSDLSLLLSGAATRAQLVCFELPEWRVFGPLEDPDVYLPLVARTGHPSLSIKWATAIELLYFDLGEGMRALRDLIARWAESPDARTASRCLGGSFGQPPQDLTAMLRVLARRPGMFLGSNSGWALRCYLHGMLRGGDWLSLPPLPALEEIVEAIEKTSTGCYGSPFAAYRVYNDAPTLLSWAGIEPEG